MVVQKQYGEGNVSGSAVSGDDKIQVGIMRGVVKAKKKKSLEMRRSKKQEHKALDGSPQWRGGIIKNNDTRWQRGRYEAGAEVFNERTAVECGLANTSNMDRKRLNDDFCLPCLLKHIF